MAEPASRENLKQYALRALGKPVIEINVEEDLLLKRITKRASESKNIRGDDNSDILKNRIIVYKRDTLPVLNYYRELNKLSTVDGMKSIEKVSEDILELLT